MCKIYIGMIPDATIRAELAKTLLIAEACCEEKF